MKNQMGPDGPEHVLKKAGVLEKDGTVYTEEALIFAASRSYLLRFDDEHKTLYGKKTLTGESVEIDTPIEPVGISFEFVGSGEKP